MYLGQSHVSLYFFTLNLLKVKPKSEVFAKVVSLIDSFIDVEFLICIRIFI